MPRNPTAEVTAHGSSTKPTPSDGEAGRIRPSLGKALTLTEGPNAAAFKCSDSEKANLKLAPSPRTTSIPAKKHGKQRSAPGSEAQSWHSMPHKTIEKLSGQDSHTKVTSSDDKAGHIEPSPGKASPQTKVSDPSAAAFKSTGSKRPKPQLASLHKEAAVPVSERRKPRSAVLPIVVCVAVVVLVGAGVLFGSRLGGATASDGAGLHPDGPDANGCPLPQNVPPDVVVVKTTSGWLLGTTVSTGEGANVTGWLGVPYTRASEDERRFAKPVPLNGSGNCEKLLAVQPRAPCAQWVNGRVLGSENCLHLNVWAPTKPTTLDNGSALDTALDNGTTLGNGTMPLLLAATGHWFQQSTNDVPQWAELAAKVGAVVVAPNVRLGVLGFLHTRNVHGLTPDVAEEDMMVAMEWALENAAAFGADSSALMLVGNGSGAYMLVQAAGRLNVSVARAVIEGSVYTSAVPANAGPMDPLKDLVGKLGCDLKDNRTWMLCLSDARLDALLGAAAKMDLRFAPLWDPMFLSIGPTGKKRPAIREVVAGTDRAQIKAFLEEYVKPRANASGNGDTATALRVYTVEYIIGRDPFTLDTLLKRLSTNSDAQLLGNLSLIMSGCATRTIARQATDRGYHYVVNGGDRPLFEPLLGIDDVARFLSHGTVPSLKNGKPWVPWPIASESLIVNDDGSEFLESDRLDFDCMIQ